MKKLVAIIVLVILVFSIFDKDYSVRFMKDSASVVKRLGVARRVEENYPDKNYEWLERRQTLDFYSPDDKRLFAELQELADLLNERNYEEFDMRYERVVESIESLRRSHGIE